jgi:protoporphyrinogen oxidase
MKVGILGGGLSGLTLANLLQTEFEVLEKNEECGGLCRSLIEEGFTFDYGGCHILFSKDDEALRFILDHLGKNKNRNKRNNKILYGSHYIKYPFENGLSDLPKEDNFECLYHFWQALAEKERGAIDPPENFREWCYRTFGKGIAEKYLIPYNEKIWKYPLEAMEVNWVRDRVPQPPMEDIIKSSIGIPTEGYTHQIYFYYPKIGGIQSVIKALESDIRERIITGFEVVSISRDNGKWLVTDNKINKLFDRIVSTIPIFALVKALSRVPLEVEEAVKRLKYNRLIAVMLGLNVPKINDYTAVYIPDAGVLPHRLGFLSNFSQGNAPAGKCTILAEITCPENDGSLWKMPDSRVTDIVVNDLGRLGIINDRRRICYTGVRRSDYAYVIYDLDYQWNISIIRSYFKKLGITLLGRFSEFEYLNMDACVRRAIEKAAEINNEN